MHWAPWVLFDAATFGTYLAAAAALVAAPGPGQALVMARTLQGGLRAGLLTSVGLNLGTLVHTVAAALGLSALLLASATAFIAVKLVGALYLVVLGVRMIASTLRARPEAAPERPAAAAPRGFRARACSSTACSPACSTPRWLCSSSPSSCSSSARSAAGSSCSSRCSGWSWPPWE